MHVNKLRVNLQSISRAILLVEVVEQPESSHSLHIDNIGLINLEPGYDGVFKVENFVRG